MATKKEKRKFSPPGIAKFPSVFFGNFGTIILTNLIFAVPIAVSFGILLAFYFTIGISIPILLLPIVLCFPFFAGVTLVTRDLTKGKKVNVWQTFLKGVKDNFKSFIIHGILIYLATMISYFSLIFYYQAAVTLNAYLYFMFGIALLLTIFIAMASLYVPVISVTLDLKNRYVYKNSALMALGELPINLLTLLCVGVFGLIIFSISFLTPNYIVGIVVIAILAVILGPSGISLIINLNVFPKVEKMLIADNKDKETVKDDSYKEEETKEEQVIPKEVVEQASKSDDEYIFYNGKMIKRSQIKNEYENIDD